ncbi:MAG TPA: DUF5009 domain-containing protein [Candidatus Acidoferrum sp.]|nr:DUF5009 domain-containing protein [Candidatus Acidoferrum sp.]
MNASAPAPLIVPGSSRLMSLDVFRGATIAGMMLVNNPGDWGAVYPPLEHAAWHGWTFTDLIFPFFLWIVGVAIPLSTARRLEQGQSRKQLFLHALRRAVIIFALGFFLNSFGYFIDGSLVRDGFPAWWHNYATTVRIPGVLQRIAICYLAATVVFLLTERVAISALSQDPGALRTARPTSEHPALTPAPVGTLQQAQRGGAMGPLASAPTRVPQMVLRPGVRGQLLAIFVLLAGYWLLMMLWPVPGYGSGILDKEGNFAQYIDETVLTGPVIGTHVWRTAKTWDPEGIVSTLPAIATCLFGVLTGQLLRSKLSPETKTSWMFIAGCVMLLAGQWMNPWLPINKSLWTSSYAVFMAGMALVGFAVCYWLVDVQGWRKCAKPFAVYGMNAITVFVLAGVLGRLSLEIKMVTAAGAKVALKTWLYEKFFAPFASPETAPCLGFLASPRNASLLWALLYVLALYLVAYAMYRKRWFVKF